jgi:hypothetical protein
MKASPRWLLVAEFDSPERLAAAARHCRAQGYGDIDAHTPFPVDGMAEALGFTERRLPWIALAGAVVGGLGTFALEYYLNGIDYPLNVGGRPLFAWPAFAVPAFELTVLGAALAGLVGMLWLSGLPRLHHPVFAASRFARVTQDRFFLSVSEPATSADRAGVRDTLEQAGALSIEAVEA